MRISQSVLTLVAAKVGTSRDAGMEIMRSHLIPGMVLGIGVGLLLGHTTIWRANPVSTGVLRPVGSGLMGETETTLLPPQFPYATSLHHSSLSAGLSSSVDDPELSSPLQNALAVESVQDTVKPHSQVAELAQNIPLAPAPKSAEPQQLPIGAATPLGGNSDLDQKVIRELIETELSHLKPEQRETWYQSLKDIDKKDALGILRMWQQLGGPPAPLAQEPKESKSSVSDVLDSPAIPRTLSRFTEDSQFAAARQIHRDNLFLANTPGYIPLTPVWTTSNGDPGELQIRLNLSQVKQIATGFPLDVAITGAGFFRVQNAEGEEFLTRNGQFRLDANQRLCLKQAGKELILIPEVKLAGLNSSTREVQIETDGQVFLKQGDQEPSLCGRIELTLPLSSASLKHRGNGLFQLEEADKNAVLRFNPTGDVTGHLVQGVLEFPEVDGAHESAAIDFLIQQSSDW